MRIVTTVLEVLGCAAVVAGVSVLFGPGWGLIVFGVLAVGFSWLVSSR
jgi:hypothetical protein